VFSQQILEEERCRCDRKGCMLKMELTPRWWLRRRRRREWAGGGWSGGEEEGVGGGGGCGGEWQAKNYQVNEGGGELMNIAEIG
jgi:hypothetical protein